MHIAGEIQFVGHIVIYLLDLGNFYTFHNVKYAIWGRATEIGKKNDLHDLHDPRRQTTRILHNAPGRTVNAGTLTL